MVEALATSYWTYIALVALSVLTGVGLGGWFTRGELKDSKEYKALANELGISSGSRILKKPHIKVRKPRVTVLTSGGKPVGPSKEAPVVTQAGEVAKV